MGQRRPPFRPPDASVDLRGELVDARRRVEAGVHAQRVGPDSKWKNLLVDDYASRLTDAAG
jgi:hypothetical protein